MVKTSADPFLANATLTVSQTNQTIVSGKKGNFRIKSLAAGTYTMVVSKFGFQSQQVTFNVNEGERTDLTITLAA